MLNPLSLGTFIMKMTIGKTSAFSKVLNRPCVVGCEHFTTWGTIPDLGAEPQEGMVWKGRNTREAPDLRVHCLCLEWRQNCRD